LVRDLLHTRWMSNAQPREHQPEAAETPFDNIESAHEYVTLLAVQVGVVRDALPDDFADATRETAGRRLDALRLVDYKLIQLKDHLITAGRLLNDLRALRRLLLGERDTSAAS
jgi:hypothetical protein